MVSSPVDQYYDINRKLLIMVGLWPYLRWRSRIIQVTLILSTLVSFTFAQLITFVTLELNINIIIKILSQLLPCLIYIVKYYSFLLTGTQVKHIIEKMRDEWIILKAPDEVDILRKYAVLSRLFTLIITVLLFLSIGILIFLQFMPEVLNIMTTLNVSRSYQLPFIAEYFVDQKQYFYPILTHGVLTGCIGSIAGVSGALILIGCVMHVLAMLKIAGYRLEHLNDKVVLLSTFEKDRIIRERIISAIDIHQRAIEFAEFFISSFMLCYFFMIILGILSLTINMYQLFEYLLSIDNMDMEHTNELLFSGIIVTSFFCYLFAANLAGQVVTDYNIDIFNKACTVQWYTISIQAQKMLLMILQKNTKNYYFNIGGIFSASLEGFTQLASMSISYFTVIYSMR